MLSEFRARWFWHSPRGVGKWAARAALALKRALASRPQVFFTYHMYYKCPDAIAPFLSLLLRRPYIVYEASYAKQARRVRGSRIGYWLTRFALARARFVFTNQGVDYENLRERVSADRLIHIPASVDTEKFSPDAESRQLVERRLGLDSQKTRLLCVAMLRNDRKSDGVEMLLQAAALVRSGGVDFELVIAGDGERRSGLEVLANALLPGRVRFLGLVPRAELPVVYASADIFAFPGIDESFGLVYVEAQACGLPVVAFDNGGIPHAVSRGKSAILTPLGDLRLYADALEELLNDKDLRSRMALEARRYAVKRHDRKTNYNAFVAKIRETTGE